MMLLSLLLNYFIASSAEGTITPMGVSIIIGALGGFAGILIGAGVRHSKLKDEFVTRREFDKLEQSLGVSVTKMESLFERTMQAMNDRQGETEKRIRGVVERTNARIDDAAEKAYQGRQRIWEQMRSHRDDIVALQTENNVSTSIGKLADALSPTSPKIQPVHVSSAK